MSAQKTPLSEKSIITFTFSFLRRKVKIMLKIYLSAFFNSYCLYRSQTHSIPSFESCFKFVIKINPAECILIIHTLLYLWERSLMNKLTAKERSGGKRKTTIEMKVKWEAVLQRPNCRKLQSIVHKNERKRKKS